MLFRFRSECCWSQRVHDLGCRGSSWVFLESMGVATPPPRPASHKRKPAFIFLWRAFVTTSQGTLVMEFLRSTATPQFDLPNSIGLSWWKKKEKTQTWISPTDSTVKVMFVAPKFLSDFVACIYFLFPTHNKRRLWKIRLESMFRKHREPYRINVLFFWVLIPSWRHTGRLGISTACQRRVAIWRFFYPDGGGGGLGQRTITT